MRSLDTVMALKARCTNDQTNQFVILLASRPLERALLFPMAVVPNVWGLWNML
jgi:hypothetical protein